MKPTLQDNAIHEAVKISQQNFLIVILSELIVLQTVFCAQWRTKGEFIMERNNLFNNVFIGGHIV